MEDKGFIIVEWSGYLDFPEGEYLYGSKDGEPISGIFSSEDVDLSSLGSADYSIDPGELSFPVSPELSFKLKNRHKFTGDKKYFFDYIRNLGRTAEYGGHNDEVGDLFIRLFSKSLNKYIYTGFVESFKYTQYDMDIEIHCSDFVKFLESDNTFLRSYNISNSKFYLEDHRGNNLSQNQNGIINKFIPNGFPEFLGTGLKDRIDNNSILQQFAIRSGSVFFIEDPDISSDVDHIKKNDILKSYLSGSMTSVYLDGASWGTKGDEISHMKNPELPNILKRIFLENHNSFKINDENVESSTFPDTGGFAWLATITTGLDHLFLQIDESTILSPIIISIYIYYSSSIPTSETTFGSGMTFEWEISSAHAVNGNSETKYDGKDLIIFERGRFLKSDNNPENTILENEDLINVILYDWGKYPNDKGFFLEENWESIPFGDLTRFKSNYIFHGIYFELDEQTGNLKASGNERGVIRIIDLIRENVNEKLVSEYTLNPYNDFDIFDTSKIENDNYKSCFVSDLVHYGFADQTIPDVLVNIARQINCYVYTNENGKITYHTRDFFKQFVNPDNLELFTQILHEDCEEISGKEYGYGKLFYSINYNDKLEINNLESSDSIKLIVGREGVTDRSVSPRSLTVSNYRTTNLGVPDSVTKVQDLPDGSNLIILRDSLSSLDEPFFLMLPQIQAQRFAQSYPYPTVLLPIKLDVLFNEEINYKVIGIGSIVYFINDEGFYEVFLVKEISYDCYDIYLGGTSMNMNLLQLATYEQLSPPIEDGDLNGVGIFEIIEEDDYDGDFPEIISEFSGIADDDFILKIFNIGFDDPDINDISISNGEESFDIVNKIVTRVNGDSSLSYTAENLTGNIPGGPIDIKFTSKTFNKRDNHGLLFTKDSQSGFGSTFNVEIDNDEPEFSGGF